MPFTSLPSASSLSSLPKISGYTLLEQIYLGSRTVVYRAVEQQNNRSVILKVLRRKHPSFSELVQFRNQYITTKKLSIAGIVHPLSLENLEMGYALVMEDCGGVTLDHYRLQQSLSLTEVLTIAIQIADILHDLCQHRIVHKDLKPANILIHPDSKEVKLLDFSIASQLPKETQEIQNPNTLEGTLAYLAPEQTGRMNRGIDYRADFYALGVTLYQLLAGQLPFISEDPLELVHCHMAKMPTPLTQIKPDVPEMVNSIITKLMAKNAENRYQSALGLKHDLQYCLDQWNTTGNIQKIELGARDFSDRFLIPERLYGREAEVEELLAAFERVAEGASEMMLVAGASGIGKTAVVNEVHKPIARQKGYFIKGKFDQFNRNSPLSAFVQALQDLMAQLLSESDDQLAQWKTQILAAIGENGQLLIDVIPELEQVIGPQPSVTELSGNAVQNRFNLIFQKFIEVFTTAEHPLVLFIDDLQWVDLASLQLLKLLMNGKGYLFMVGAYRDNEISPTHPFVLTLEELKKTNTIVHKIDLQPLKVEQTNHLIADTLNCSLEFATPLTELIDRKTKGNPFFTTQFLKALHEGGQISFDPDRRYWKCDINQINTLALTDDVVAFMALQLQKLSPKTQQVLKLAACIGNQFDLETLEIVSDQSQGQIAKDLWPALQEGLILPINQVYKFFQSTGKDLSDRQDPDHNYDQHHKSPTYRFLHDRVQQAAYSLIPDDEKSRTQLKIGQSLLKKSSTLEQEEHLFDIVGYLNQGQHLMTDRAQREQLVRLNLKAGDKAKRSTAYSASINYLSIAIQLLLDQTVGQTVDKTVDQAWEQNYDLMFAVHREQAEVAYLSGNLTESEALIETTLAKAHSALEKAELYHLLIMQKSAIGNYAAAIQLGIHALSLLGVTIDREKTQQSIDQESEEIQQFLEAHSIASLLDLPEMLDPRQRLIVQLLIDLDPPSYITGDLGLYILVTMKVVNTSIKYGNIPVSSKAYANYGLITGSILGNYKPGYDFGVLALNLSHKFHHMSQCSQVSLVLGSWLSVWSRPIAGVTAINTEGYQAGLLGGEPQFAGYNLFGNVCNQLFQGETLNLILSDIKVASIFAKEHQNLLLMNILMGVQLFAESLTCDDITQGQNSIVTHSEFIDQCQSSQTVMAKAIYHICQMQLACIQQDANQGHSHDTYAEPILASILGFTTSSSYYFYSSLLILLDQQNASEIPENSWEKVEFNQAKLETWSENCPENFLNKYVLVQAEIARVKGLKIEAIELYDQAIKLAKTNGFIPEVALANELAARFYVNWGKENFAIHYMQEAYYSYMRWGAKAKIKDLENRYPQLLKLITQQKQKSLSTTETIATPYFLRTFQGAETQHATMSATINATMKTESISKTFDLEAILKASQALSSEIQFDKLLATLLNIVLENAGADTGILLMPHDREWYIEAIATVHEATQVQAIALSDSDNLPHSVIHTVKRSQKSLVISNTRTHKSLATDSYIIKHQPRSLLCTPIMKQGKLVAILYLENQVTFGAFTSDRLEVLQLLSSQFAIALENSQHYNTLEQKVAQRTEDLSQALHQLRQTQSQLIQAEKMSSLVQLIAGIAHEINNPVNFIHGNLQHISHYSQDLLNLLGLYQAELPNPSLAIREKLEEIDLEFVTEDLSAVLKSMDTGTQRIRDIVKSLRNFSRLDEAEVKSIDIHSGIDSSLMILQSRIKSTARLQAIQIVKNYGDLSLVQCHAGQINQVFMNILTNAIDALDEIREKNHGEAVPCIEICTEAMGNDRIKITIADNGIGIPEAIQAQIFDPFFTTKPVGKGTGMGLAISYQIITEQHKGTLVCDSSPGKGSRFEMEIPIIQG